MAILVIVAVGKAVARVQSLSHIRMSSDPDPSSGGDSTHLLALQQRPDPS
jgi:hypothetical protein